MMIILVIMEKVTVLMGAMQEEITSILEVTNITKKSIWNNTEIFQGTLHNKNVVVAKSGVGKVMSAMLTQYLIDNFPVEKIIFTGLAGAIDSRLNIGDIVIATKLAQYDLDVTELGFKLGQIPFTDIQYIECDKTLLAIAEKFHSKSHKVTSGIILTGDTFMTNKKKELYNSNLVYLKGIALEMEGASVGLSAFCNNVAFIVIRTISDKADHSAHVNFNDFLPVASANSLEIILHILENS
jgi:adenosylhomocysteine nucleosidase